MINELEIRRAFIRKIKQILPATPVAMENDEFDPPENQLWIEPYILPVGKDSMGKSQGDSDEYTGVYHVAIYVPLNTGVKDALNASQALSDELYHGVELESNGITVFIDKTEVKQGFRTGAFWQTPVQITFNSYIARK